MSKMYESFSRCYKFKRHLMRKNLCKVKEGGKDISYKENGKLNSKTLVSMNIKIIKVMDKKWKIIYMWKLW